MATCRSCGAEIVWVHTEKGRAMPVDVKPRKGVVLDMGIAKVVNVFTSHFETCPDAAAHRKPRGEGHE